MNIPTHIHDNNHNNNSNNNSDQFHETINKSIELEDIDMAELKNHSDYVISPQYLNSQCKKLNTEFNLDEINLNSELVENSK